MTTARAGAPGGPPRQPNVVLTIDQDWAPDFASDVAIDALISARAHATWFITHRGSTLDRLRRHPDLFEVGIHPNFGSGSSHGANPVEVLDHCMDVVPEARSMRSHGLVTSTAILDHVVRETPIEADATLFLRRATWARPNRYRWADRELWRVPYVFEDDLEFHEASPGWDGEWLFNETHPLVVDFHPIHIYLNSSANQAYEQLKARSIALPQLDKSAAAALIHGGQGVGSLFGAILRRSTTMTVAELVAGQR